MKVKTPFKNADIELNSENMDQWEKLSSYEKIFYKYLVEYDTTLSSVLLGIFTAYVVNLISNLLTLDVKNIFMFVSYALNMVFALRTLYFVVKLYRIHVLLEKLSINDVISVRVNKDLEFLFSKHDHIADNVNMLKKSIIGLVITLLLCFAIYNDLLNGIHMVLEWIVGNLGELLIWKK